MQTKKEAFNQLVKGSVENLVLALNTQPELIFEAAEDGMTLFEHATFQSYNLPTRPDLFSVIVQTTIKNKIDFAKIAIHGKSLLHIAVNDFGGLKENNNNVECILRYNPSLDLNTISSSGMTALGFAIKNNQYYNAKTLILAGADVTLGASKKQKPLALLETGLLNLRLLKVHSEQENLPVTSYIKECFQELTVLKELLLVRIESRAEIKKNARVLLSLAYEENSCLFFNKISPEVLIRIAAHTRNYDVHTEKEAYDMAYKSLNRPEAEQKPDTDPNTASDSSVEEVEEHDSTCFIQ